MTDADVELPPLPELSPEISHLIRDYGDQRAAKAAGDPLYEPNAILFSRERLDLAIRRALAEAQRPREPMAPETVEQKVVRVRAVAGRVKRELVPMLQKLVDVPVNQPHDLVPTREARKRAVDEIERDILLYVTNAAIGFSGEGSNG